MIIKVKPLIALLVTLCCTIWGYSEYAQADSLPTPAPIATPRSPQSLFADLASSWSAVEEATARHDFRSVVEQGSGVAAVARRIGLRSLNDYALTLLEQGNERLRLRDYDGAALYARKIVEFSPRSSRVLLLSLPLMVETHTRTAYEQLQAALASSSEEIDLPFRLFATVCYPLLWAITIAVYIVAVITVVAAPRQFLNALRQRLPSMPDIGLAFVALMIFVVPSYFGVLSAIATWSIALVLLVPEQRWVGVWAGVVIALWGALIPIRENIDIFLQSDGGQALTRALNGDYRDGDEGRLAELARFRPSDGTVLYGYGLTLRRLGVYPQAAIQFERAERVLDNRPAITAERGVVAYQSRKLDEAIELHRRAEERGLKSTPFFFNFSKVYFDKLDTQGSRHYFELATGIDSKWADNLRRREEGLGVDGVLGVVDMPLGVSDLYRTALQPIEEARSRAAKLFSTLTPVESPVAGVFLGIAMVLLALLSRSRHAGMYHPESRYAVLLRIIPGGSFVMRGRGGWAIFTATIASLLALPLIAWPVGSERIFTVISSGAPYYVGFFMLYLLLCPWIGHTQE